MRAGRSPGLLGRPQPGGTADRSGPPPGTLFLFEGAANPGALPSFPAGRSQALTVVVNAGAVSAGQSTVTATSPIAAGRGTSTITVTAKDANGNPIQGATVTLAAPPTAGNTLTQPVGTTDASGQIAGTLRSAAAGRDRGPEWAAPRHPFFV